MRQLFALLFLFSLTMTAPLAADQHDHHHHDAPKALQLDHGKPWQTDATLRKNMASLADTLRQKTAAIHQGRLSASEYAALGKAIDQAIGDIVKNCQLSAEADAMLHIILAELIAGAETLQGKADANKAEAAHRVVIALNNYGAYFSHQGWVAVR